MLCKYENKNRYVRKGAGCSLTRSAYELEFAYTHMYEDLSSGKAGVEVAQYEYGYGCGTGMGLGTDAGVGVGTGTRMSPDMGKWDLESAHRCRY